MESLKEAKWKLSDIYLEDRYESPKFVFKMVVAMLLEQFGEKAAKSLLDVGTAEGALPHYLQKHLSGWKFAGLEHDPMLVKLAKEKVPFCSTEQGDANSMPQYKDKSFDAVTCLGVLSIFDDYRPCISELIRVCSDGGIVLVNNMWNAFPVDLIIKTRNSTPGPNDKFDNWEAGWNMVSISTISGFLENHPRVKSFDFTKVVLPYDLPSRPENPMRSWTNMGSDGERYHMNGIGRLLDKRVLRIQLK